VFDPVGLKWRGQAAASVGSISEEHGNLHGDML
jgi:hypothetical protein